MCGIWVTIVDDNEGGHCPGGQFSLFFNWSIGGKVLSLLECKQLRTMPDHPFDAKSTCNVIVLLMIRNNETMLAYIYTRLKKELQTRRFEMGLNGRNLCEDFF